MKMKDKYFSLLEATKSAATLSNSWKDSESGEIFNSDSLLSYSETGDDECPLDSDDEETYYIVSENGDIGFTGNDGKKIKWMFLSLTKKDAEEEDPAADEPKNNFCGNCGAPITAGTKFCKNCGTKFETDTPLAQDNKTTLKRVPAKKANSSPENTKSDYVGPIGFSDKINDPRVKDEIKKLKKANSGCMIFGVPISLIVMLIANFATDEIGLTDALIFGGGFSLLLLILVLAARLRSRAKNSWDGFVTDKQHYSEKRHVKRTDENEHRRWMTIEYERYDLTVRTDAGKTVHILEKIENRNDKLKYYWYFNVGDHIRYYPQLPYEYEKYDKSHDTEIPCMACGYVNDIKNDKCEDCGCPLFK